MKILKLLNRICLPIFFIIAFSNIVSTTKAEEEPVDIWDLEKKIKKNKPEIIYEDLESQSETILESGKFNNTKSISIKGNDLQENINLAGIYDPAENGLKINMWYNSDGKEIISIFNRLNKVNLSSDAQEILNIALLTNSYFPKTNISEKEFLNFKYDYLINNEDLKLIKLYLKKNQNSLSNSKLVKHYVNEYLANSDLDSACNIFNEINLFDDDYLTKFKIYCLINEKNREEAQIQFDLLKEFDFNDKFFENKFNFLMGYISETDQNISEKNILDFHLSHKTNSSFEYKPKENTSKIIWQYLASSNLLENIEKIDLEDEKKILLIEKATHDKNYSEQELLKLYKRFQFNIDQLLNVKDVYKLLPTYRGRALLYQRLLLTKEPIEILDLTTELKNSFIEEDIGDAFSEELSKILNNISVEDVPSNYSTFYAKNKINQNVKKINIKINNKIIHQSKLLNYFKEDYEIKKIEKDTNDLIKKIKKKKDYIITKKDLMILESLISDGVKISKKYQNLFEFNQSNIPTDIQLLINNNEVGMALLRIIEIIGEDDLENLGPDTLYFIVSTLNQLDIDPIRNNILLKILPLKV